MMGQKENSAFTVEDLIQRLGYTVVDAQSQEASPHPTVALAEHRATPTIKAIGYDLARVAAFTSQNPEGARKRWRDRLVMRRDAQGNATDVPWFIGVVFTGSKATIEGIEDIGIAAFTYVEGLGQIEIQPLFTVGFDYELYLNADGTYVSRRAFSGCLFAPIKPHDKVYKFVPLELADRLLVERYNLIVQQGKQLGTIHGDWPTITPVESKIHRPGSDTMMFAPTRFQRKTWSSEVRGRKTNHEDIRIGTHFRKVVILDRKSQEIPRAAIQSNVDAWNEYNAGQIDAKTRNTAQQRFVFRYIEREGSILVSLMGREGEVVEEPTFTFDDVPDTSNPFEILATTVEEFSPGVTRTFIETCMRLPLNKGNPLYLQALALGLVIKGQPRAVVRHALGSLATTAFEKTQKLWLEALNETWQELKRFTLPILTECLPMGLTLAQAQQARIRRDDAIGVWITNHIVGEFNRRSPFHLEIRRRLITEAAKRQQWQDPTETPLVQPASNGASEPAIQENSVKVVDLPEGDLEPVQEEEPASTPPPKKRTRSRIGTDGSTSPKKPRTSRKKLEPKKVTDSSDSSKLDPVP